MKSLYLEFKKIRYRKLWLTIVILVGVQFLWTLWSSKKMDEQALEQGWMYFLYQLSSLNTLMMPIAAAVVASRLCDTEHKGGMLKLMYTVVPRGKLFLAKFLCGSIFMALAALLQVLLILFLGKTRVFAGNAPADRLLFYLLTTIAVNVTILLFQQVLSLFFVNQMIPLTAGLVGSFAGLFSLFFPGSLKRLLIWGYYGVLANVNLNWDQKTRHAEFYYTPTDWAGLLMLAVMFAGIYLLGQFLLKRKEL